jgi:uncharacterized phiE125 gp8 family phage protein
MRLRLIQGPADMPVTAALIKSQLDIDFADDDSLIDAYIAAAVSYLDGRSGILGRCIVNQDWLQPFSAWPASHIRLTFPDVSAATVIYVDPDGATQTVPSDQYEIVEEVSGAALRLMQDFTFPALHSDRAAPISVTFTAGYGDKDAPPKSLVLAIMHLVVHWYETRVAVSVALQKVPLSFNDLVAPHRWVSL